VTRLELLGYFPKRDGSRVLARRFSGRGAGAKALRLADLWERSGAARVQLAGLSGDRWAVLQDRRSSAWLTRVDEAGRIAKKQAW